MLSFAVASLLHLFTGDYIFTERMLSLLSLILCSLLIAAIVHTLSTSAAPTHAIRHHGFSAVQLSAPPERCESCWQRFAPAVMAAIQDSYAPALQMKNAIIYTPKSDPHLAGNNPLRTTTSPSCTR